MSRPLSTASTVTLHTPAVPSRVTSVAPRLSLNRTRSELPVAKLVLVFCPFCVQRARCSDFVEVISFTRGRFTSLVQYTSQHTFSRSLLLLL